MAATYDLHEGVNRIGRGPGSHILLDHVQVSRSHAQVCLHKNGSAVLSECWGSSGIWLNGQRVTRSAALKAGDEISIGPFILAFDAAAKALRRQSLERADLVCQGLTRTVTDRTSGRPLILLNNISLVIEPGEFVCLLGPSGSGKSTLLQAMSARVPADDGSVLINGLDFYGRFDSLKQRVAVVPQRDVLHDLLSLETALRYTARLRQPSWSERDRQAKIAQILETVELTDRRQTTICNLSGGQQKRASLANEILSEPTLLFLDEVTSGLDERTDREMMTLFQRVARGGKTVICVTHSLVNVEQYCTLVVILAKGGRLGFIGTPREARYYFGNLAIRPRPPHLPALPTRSGALPRLGDVYDLLEFKSDVPPQPPAGSPAEDSRWRRLREAMVRPCRNVAGRAVTTWQAVRGWAMRVLGGRDAVAAGNVSPLEDDKETKHAEWLEREFKKHGNYRKYVVDRLNKVKARVYPPVSRQKLTFRDVLGGTFTQSTVLTSRYLRLLVADARSMAMMLTQCLLVAFLLVIIFGNLTSEDVSFDKRADYSGRLLFLMTVSCLWFGCNNAAKELVKERTIYERERDVNLMIPCYYGSKICLLGILSVAQAWILFGIVKWLTQLPGDAWGQGLFLSTLALVGVAVGLLISAIAKTTDMAVTIVPIVLIPQIALAGLVAPVEGFGKLLAQLFVTAYWGYHGLATILPGDIVRHLGCEKWSTGAAYGVLLLHIVLFAGVTLYILYRQDPRARSGGLESLDRWITQATDKFENRVRKALTGGRDP